jgi:hypothetical protein
VGSCQQNGTSREEEKRRRRGDLPGKEKLAPMMWKVVVEMLRKGTFSESV